MAKIEPFQSVHYNTGVVEDPSKVVCPPYDIIGAAKQEEYYQRHPYNMIRLILGKELAGDKDLENQYTRAAGYMDEWSRRGVLMQDAKPAIYFYEQTFCVGKERKSRLGFIALMQLDEEGSDQSIYPHEHTHTAPKEDRMKLMEAVEANLSPIFTVFSDQKGMIRDVFEKEVRKTPAFFSFEDEDGIENKIWQVHQESLIEKVKAFLSEKDLFIADGHHRHEVARMFRDKKRSQHPNLFKKSYNYIMTYFTALEDPGLCVLPTHRLVKNVRFDVDIFSSCFSIKELPSKEKLVSEMEEKMSEPGVFGLYKDNKFYLLKLTDKRECNRLIQDGPKEYKNLDVVILQKVIFDSFLKIPLSQVQYEVDLDKGIKFVDEKACDALFVMNATKIDQIRSIALSGEVMPQKSTYFYPKLLSGLLIHKF
ncbi:MAG: DUF1015 domain-containing protein [Candidatus Omnitrophota bacterium]